MKQITRKEVVPDENIPVIWVAKGEHVYLTPLSEFEQKIEEAKQKGELRSGYLSSMHGKRYAR